MAENSKIEWTDATWNPVRGCTKISPGCKHCYAETFAERFRGVSGHPYEQGFDLRLVLEKLNDPLAWKKPKRVFVNSMSDLFHEDIPLDYIQRVFDVMNRAYWHTFQVLTKRADRLARLAPFLTWTRNIWIGTSVENQEQADRRIAYLENVPAAVRFLSCEPLLGDVDLKLSVSFAGGSREITDRGRAIHWVITGGESGHNARPCHPDWIRGLRDQCQVAGTAFFFKQWGEWEEEMFTDEHAAIPDRRAFAFDDGLPMVRTGKKAAGRLLDGHEWNQFPGEKQQ